MGGLDKSDLSSQVVGSLLEAIVGTPSSACDCDVASGG